MTWALSGKPFEVQVEAGRLAEGHEGFAYFMEMGLGKSSVALDEFVKLLKAGVIQHLMIHCPNSLKMNWADEIKKWGVEVDVVIWPKVPKFIIKGGKNTYTLDRPTAWIFNYESLIHSGGEEVEKFLKACRCMWVLDESSCIKNFNAKSTKAAIAMSTSATVRRVLTGTPMTQSVMDLWPQLRFIGALKGVNPYQFRNRYAAMGGYMGKQVVGSLNEQELQAILKACAFQAKKKDWLDLPEKTFTTRYVDMEPSQSRAYSDMKRDFLLMMNDSTVISAPMVITQLGKLQQISRGFVYDEERDAQMIVDMNRNPCLKIVQEVLDQIEGKLVVMAHHKESIRLLREYFKGINPATIIGGQTDDFTKAEKARFNDDPDCRMIITQIGVGGIGHTLLGGPTAKTRCSTMLFFENVFSLEKRLQAEDRIHRIGQDRACTYIDIVASPVCRKIVMALQKKVEIVKAVMEGVKNNEL